jgi:hypothetical protein
MPGAARIALSAIGSWMSLHKSRLVIDLNLFYRDEYITTNLFHDELHDWWSTNGGAAPVRDDFNHYSIEHDGRR